MMVMSAWQMSLYVLMILEAAERELAELKVSKETALAAKDSPGVTHILWKSKLLLPLHRVVLQAYVTACKKVQRIEATGMIVPEYLSLFTDVVGAETYNGAAQCHIHIINDSDVIRAFGHGHA